jgi:hypothetical protein
MAICLSQMRDELLPGLTAVGIFAAETFNSSVPEMSSVSIPAALAMGAAAVVMTNPVVPRRSLFSFFGAR